MSGALAHHHPRRRPPAHPGDRDAGMTLIITTFVLTALLITAAVVVDIGAVYAARREDQASADSGALGAAQDLANEAVAVSQVKTVVHRNLGHTLSAAQWNSCGSDPARLDLPAVGANCISFNRARSRVRVRVPDQFVSTAFGTIVGIDEIRHAAFAIAAVNQRGFGGVLPFGMPAGAGSGDGYACVKASSGGLSSAPCNGPDSGNFGTIDLSHYGNEDVGTTKSCGSGDTRDRIANNIAVGSDHRLEIAGDDPTRVDTELCQTLTAGPNGATTQTGNNQGPVGRGLLSGSLFSDGGPARLQRRDPELFSGAGRTRLVHTHPVDDNPLWQFIPESLQSGAATGGDVPRSCQRDQFVDSSGNPLADNPLLPTAVRAHLAPLSLRDRMLALMQRCMTHYRGQSWGGGAVEGRPALNPPEPRQGCGGSLTTAPCTDPVFGRDSSGDDAPNLYDIQYTPRFGYVPEIEGSFPNGSSAAVRFQSFKAIFIQRLIVGNGAGATVFDPGYGPSALGANSETDVREVTLWVFPPGMLPGRLQERQAPYAIGVNRFVQLVG